MKRLIKYLICLFTLLYTFADSYSQVKKPVRKNKTPSPEKTEQLVFKSEEDLNKWFYQDSLKRAREDSINYIKDSIESEIETQKWAIESKKIYQENWYPKDSLSYIDDIVEKMITANRDIEVDSAVLLINNRFTGSLQKARAIYFWIASTVKYDYNAFTNDHVEPIDDDSSDAINTFKNKKGVCQNYANLYKYMCDKSGIECEFITGLGKNFPFSVNPQEESNHAWNCVKTNKGWILIDVTWATIDTSDRVDRYWFNTPPQQFIYSHLPGDSLLQFLKKDISKKDFLDFPIVSPFLFISKLDFEIPEHGNLRLTGNKFSISVPQEEKNYTIGYSIIPYKGDDWRPYISNLETQTLDTKKMVNKKNGTVDYEVEIPAKGVWWLSVTLNKRIKNKYLSEVSFPQVIIFRITY